MFKKLKIINIYSIKKVIVFFIQKSKTAYTHLNEVYSELVKVVWPEKDSVLKVTIGIVIGLTFVSLILLGVDYACRTILGFLY